MGRYLWTEVAVEVVRGYSRSESKQEVRHEAREGGGVRYKKYGIDRRVV